MESVQSSKWNFSRGTVGRNGPTSRSTCQMRWAIAVRIPGRGRESEEPPCYAIPQEATRVLNNRARTCCHTERLTRDCLSLADPSLRRLLFWDIYRSRSVSQRNLTPNSHLSLPSLRIPRFAYIEYVLIPTLAGTA